jgi:hypothetical protein
MAGQSLEILNLTGVVSPLHSAEVSGEISGFRTATAEDPAVCNSIAEPAVGLGCMRAIRVILCIEAVAGLIGYLLYCFFRAAH